MILSAQGERDHAARVERDRWARKPLADDVCETPTMCTDTDDDGDCRECGFPASSHNY